MANEHGGKRAGSGRKPIPRAPDERLVEKTITITESDIVYLLTFDPKNLSGAIRKLIATHR